MVRTFISLPAGVFNPYSGVKTSILILDRRLAKSCDSVLFVKVENDGFVIQLEAGLTTAREAQTELIAATRKFSERVDHVSDLAVLYHMNTRLLLGVELAIQHLENVA